VKPSLRRQRGQALLLVLIFVAAFLLLVWAALKLSSSGFLALTSVRADTRATYALDAGMAFAIELEDDKFKPLGCTPDLGKTFTLPYASGNITVTLTVTPSVGCKPSKPTYDVQVTLPASVSTRSLSVQIHSSNAGKKGSWLINWEQYQ
jgi:hypothetical protein